MNKKSLGEEKIEFATSMFKLLGHPLRLRLVELLDLHGEANVNELAELTQKSQATVSLYLSRLKDCGLLNRRRDGKLTYYSIAEPRLSKLLSCIRSCPLEDSLTEVI